MGGRILAVGGRSPLIELLLMDGRCASWTSVFSDGTTDGAIVDAIDMDLPLLSPPPPPPVEDAILVVLVWDPGVAE